MVTIILFKEMYKLHYCAGLKFFVERIVFPNISRMVQVERYLLWCKPPPFFSSVIIHVSLYFEWPCAQVCFLHFYL